MIHITPVTEADVAVTFVIVFEYPPAAIRAEGGQIIKATLTVEFLVKDVFFSIRQDTAAVYTSMVAHNINLLNLGRSIVLPEKASSMIL